MPFLDGRIHFGNTFNYKEKLDMAIDMASMDNVLESYTNAREGGGRPSLRNDGWRTFRRPIMEVRSQAELV